VREQNGFGLFVVDLRTFDEVVWSATYPSETDD
jgi:hypothetical protein